MAKNFLQWQKDTPPPAFSKKHLAVIVAFRLSLLAGAVAGLFTCFHPTYLSLALTLTAFASAASCKALLYLTSKHLARLTLMSDDHFESEGLITLRRGLTRFRYEEGVESLAIRAALQLDRAEDKFRAFRQLLAVKLNPDELTFQRYLKPTEQIYGLLVDAVAELLTLIETAATWPPDAGSVPLSPPEAGAYKTPHLRLAGKANAFALPPPKAKVLERMEQLFLLNERALTEFDRITAALTEMNGRAGNSDAAFKAAVRDLEELAKRASKF